MNAKAGKASHADQHADHKEKERRIEHTRHWFLFFAALSVATFVELFDSFQQATRHHEISAEIARIAIEPTLEILTGQHDRDEAARKAITVFYVDRQTQIDEKDNGALAFTTPNMPYARHAAYLSAIAAHGPKVIFLDYVFYREPKLAGPGRKSDPADEASGYEALVTEIAKARASGIKVYTGLTSNPTRFKELSGLEDQVATSWPRGRHVLDYPLAGISTLDGVGTDRLPTAAVAIYREVCKYPKFACDPKALPEEVEKDGKPETEPDPILVHWPQYGAHPNELYGQSPACRKAPGSALDGYGRSLARNLLYNATNPEHTAPDKCLYISGFPLNSVFTFAPLHKFNTPLLEDYVRGKVVMIGDGMSDVFEVPGHGMVPGVYHHAFALQNLLARGKGYIRWPYELHIGPLTLQVNFIIEWLLTALEVFIATGFVRLGLGKVVRRIAWVTRRRGLAGWQVAASVVGLAVVGVVVIAYLVDLFMYWQLHWIPVNPLYVLILIAGLHVLSEQDRFFRWWTGLGVATRAMSVAIPALVLVVFVLGLWLRYLT